MTAQRLTVKDALERLSRDFIIDEADPRWPKSVIDALARRAGSLLCAHPEHPMRPTTILLAVRYPRGGPVEGYRWFARSS